MSRSMNRRDWLRALGATGLAAGVGARALGAAPAAQRPARRMALQATSSPPMKSKPAGPTPRSWAGA